jgi:hypothetical protein
MDEEVSLLAIPRSDTLDWFVFSLRDGVPFVDAVATLSKVFFFSFITWCVFTLLHSKLFVKSKQIGSYLLAARVAISTASLIMG